MILNAEFYNELNNDAPKGSRRYENDDIAILYSKRSKKKRNSRAYQLLTKKIRAKLKKILNISKEFETKSAKIIAKLGWKIVVEDMDITKMNKKKHNKPGSTGLHREVQYAKMGSMRSAIEWETKKRGLVLRSRTRVLYIKTVLPV